MLSRGDRTRTCNPRFWSLRAFGSTTPFAAGARQSARQSGLDRVATAPPCDPSALRSTLPGVAAPPTGIDWDALSLRSREIVLHIVVPLSAGYEYVEVAERLTRNRPELRHLELPPKSVSKLWVQARCRELRREIEERHAASY
jgi:hypothetical protein